MNNTFIAEEENAQNIELTPEQIAVRKQEMLDFYNEQIDFMQVQLEFEKLSADIEEHRLRRLLSIVRQAQIQSPSEPDEEVSEQKQPEKKRDLKRS